jgi:solute carrier organic anion transporter family, member 5A
MNLTAAGFVMVGTLFDIGTWYYAKNVKIFDDDIVNPELINDVELEPIKNTIMKT